jgi:ATP-dependent Clp protease ATP-binding subunit ClpA
MTTNAGATEMSRASIGFTHQDHTTDGMGAIKRIFTPEFRNRLDAIVQFAPLEKATLHTVVDKFLVELQSQLDDKKVVLHVDDAARNWLAEHGYDRNMGARPMTRLIKEKIKKPLAEEVLFGSLSSGGGQVEVTVEADDICLHIEEAVQLTPA